MDTNINIIFSNQSSGGTESDPECPGVTPNPEAPEQNKTGGKESDRYITTAKAMALSIGKQSITSSLSRVGTYTRSNVKQERVNEISKLAGIGVGLGVSLISGNLASAVMIGASAIGSAISEQLEFNTNKNIESRGLAVRNQRAGINRSR